MKLFIQRSRIVQQCSTPRRLENRSKCVPRHPQIPAMCLSQRARVPRHVFIQEGSFREEGTCSPSGTDPSHSILTVHTRAELSAAHSSSSSLFLLVIPSCRPAQTCPLRIVLCSSGLLISAGTYAPLHRGNLRKLECTEICLL